MILCINKVYPILQSGKFGYELLLLFFVYNFFRFFLLKIHWKIKSKNSIIWVNFKFLFFVKCFYNQIFGYKEIFPNFHTYEMPTEKIPSKNIPTGSNPNWTKPGIEPEDPQIARLYQLMYTVNILPSRSIGLIRQQWNCYISCENRWKIQQKHVVCNF